MPSWQTSTPAALSSRRCGEASSRIGLVLLMWISALRVRARPGDVALPGKVELAEISGSDTFVHVSTPVGEVVAQLTGVHDFNLGAAVTLHVDPAQVYAFDAAGQLLTAPARNLSGGSH